MVSKTPHDASLRRNLLVKVKVGAESLKDKPDLIGILQKQRSATKSEANTGGSEHPHHVSIFYTAASAGSTRRTQNSLYFAIRLQRLSVGHYKFMLRSTDSKDLIGSNSVDFEIVSMGTSLGLAFEKGNDNVDKDTDGEGTDDSDMDDFDNLDKFGGDFDCDQQNLGDNGDFDEKDIDFMFDQCKGQPSGILGNSDRAVVDMGASVINLEKETNGGVVAKVRDFLGLGNGVLGRHFLIAAALVLIMAPTLERTKENTDDVVYVYGRWLVDCLGISQLSTNVCSFLLGKDCSAHMHYAPGMLGLGKDDYYTKLRDPVPMLTPIVSSLGKAAMPLFLMGYSFGFPSDVYERDRFGYKAGVVIGLLEILKSLLSGYHPAFALPMVGPLLLWYLFEEILLPKYIANSKNVYKKVRSYYVCISVFMMYLSFLPAREWVAMKYGRGNDLPPPTIAYALMAQQAFSQGLPLLVMTRIKGYFPLDWVLFIVFGSLVLSLASACARALGRDIPTSEGVVLDWCQIFPYYVAPLLFSGLCSRLFAKPLITLARRHYESSGKRWDRGDNMCA